MKSQVFLGGSCNPTTWRQDTAMPMLTEAGVEHFNPQVEDWTPDCADLERVAKEESQVLLFVIDGQTRAIASILEVTEFVLKGRQVVLVVNDIDDGAVITDQAVTGGELKDLNRARAYAREMASNYDNAVLVDDVSVAVDVIATMLKS
ncbi:hypothetical protein HON36_00675 [Candidatus Parcubacteria bacterium]|jgi:raw|nr:hypothetical protein [Candidatus Parcubacteria bacterium]MBT7228910.1 hypothetical protein [Candidatus Parcubacteria bacterium]